MQFLSPRLKHLAVSQTPLALEAIGAAARWTGASRRALRRAPEQAFRVLAYHQTPAERAPAFRRQMLWLARNRSVVAPGDLIESVLAGRIPGKDTVAITFDDGFANNFDVAVPVLRELGMRACFFVSTDFIDLAGKGPEALRAWQERVYRFTRAAEPMTWDRLRRLASEGFEIGVHTKSHPNLGRLSPAEVEAEIRSSSERLRLELGIAPTLFAYPYGKTAMAPPSVRPVVMRAGGFSAAFSTERGWNTAETPREWLRRDSMEPHLSPSVLEAFLSGFFDR